MLRRGFFTCRRFSSQSSLEHQASSQPTNAQLQTSLYTHWLNANNPHQIISRVQSRKFALDHDGARVYVDALNRVGRGRDALGYVVDGCRGGSSFGGNGSSPFNGSGGSSSINGGSSSSFHGGSSFGIGSGSANSGGFFKTPQLNQKTMFSLSEPASTSNTSNTSRLVGEMANGSMTNPLYVLTKKAPPSPAERLASMLRIVFFSYILLAAITTYSEELGKVVGIGKSANFTEINPKDATKTGKKITTFKDVQGVDEAKEELKEVVEFLKDPAKFTKLGGKLPKGVLLTGEPGTGKTLLARAVAGEANVPFYHCSGSDFDEMYVGVGAKRVRELFTTARKNTPCIVFIDEIDAIGGTRNPKDQQFARMTLNQLLVEMDGFNESEGLIVMGATNFPQTLDKALLRPGRFDRNVVVELPDVKGRLEILKLHTKTVPLSKNVTLNTLARSTVGFSGADLANIINYAALRAASASHPSVTQSDIDWAFDRIVMGLERKNLTMSDKTRSVTAYHEAGHAVMALFTPGAMGVHKATIIPRGKALGYVAQLPDDDDELSGRSYTQLLAKLDVCMGGRASEELIFGAGEITTGASSDLEQATHTARTMVLRCGMTDLGKTVLAKDQNEYMSLSSETRRKVEEKVEMLLEESYERTKGLLAKRRDVLERVAKALLKFETLSREELESVAAGKEIRVGDDLA